VLLIIFMVIVPVRQMDLEVKIPQPPVPGPPNPNVIVVDIGEFGNYEINHQKTTIHQLGDRLQEIYSVRPSDQRNMFIRALPQLPYSDVVRVIDIAKGAGVGDIGLMTPEEHR
jgi:biopolymer transport protein ExbD